MTAPALIKSSDLKRMADVVKAKGVRVEMEIGGKIIRVMPDPQKFTALIMLTRPLPSEEIAWLNGALAMKVNLVGIHRVKKLLADGSERLYYYAWRGGPRMESNPDSLDFTAEYVRLVRDREDAPFQGCMAGKASRTPCG